MLLLVWPIQVGKTSSIQIFFKKASIRTLKRVNDKNDQQQTLINLESFSKIQIKYLELKNVPRHSNFIPDGYTVELTPKIQ